MEMTVPFDKENIGMTRKEGRPQCMRSNLNFFQLNGMFMFDETRVCLFLLFFVSELVLFSDDDDPDPEADDDFLPSFLFFLPFSFFFSDKS